MGQPELLVSVEVFSAFIVELVRFYLKAAELFKLSPVPDEAEMFSFLE
ncbi:MAG: hypothetical protein JXR70_09340 [Spirochaetales bacterium]|nr:hypothetical protein [Spirochaetales bacterium]